MTKIALENRPCEVCLSIDEVEELATYRVSSLYDRDTKVYLCEEHYDEWCAESEMLITNQEEDDY